MMQCSCGRILYGTPCPKCDGPTPHERAPKQSSRPAERIKWEHQRRVDAVRRAFGLHGGRYYGDNEDL